MDQTTRSEHDIDALFADYLKETRNLRNFTDKTLDNCQQIFKSWNRFIGGLPTESAVQWARRVLRCLCRVIQPILPTFSQDFFAS